MKLKKGDVMIIALVVMIALGWYLKDVVRPDTAAKTVVIKVEDRIYARIPLTDTAPREIPVQFPGNNHIHVIVADGKVWVDDATCPDKVCVRTGKIDKSGQSIVCLPYKTVIYLEGAAESEIDAVSY